MLCFFDATKEGNSGFSLFELLVVLFIIGIMATLVGPRLTGSLPSLRVKTAAKQTAALLRDARSRAVTENQVYQSTFDLNTQQVTLIKKEEKVDPESKDQPATQHSIIYTLPESVFFKDVERREKFNINFYPSGGSSGGQLSLINNKDTSWFLTVDRITGRTTISAEQ